MEKLLEKKQIFEENGIKCKVNEEPFCCVFLTPIMQRAHNMKFSSEIVFVDSSGSCDQGGCSVTFLLGASKVGGIPLGAIIHNFQTEEVYELGFKMLNELLEQKGFYGAGFPMILMTDDSSAEIDALQKVFPASQHLLCTFHILQAMWRWLWDAAHHIEKQDRRILMMLFRDVVYAQNTIDCELYKKSLYENEIAKKYDNFFIHFENIWTRKLKWAHCYRKDLITRGHNTNNIIEVSIRILKDFVLQRCKAFNAVSLSCFITHSLEEFYKQKCILYANGRGFKLDLYFKKFCYKASLLNVTKETDTIFSVTSSKDKNILYTVDTLIEQCDCPAGVGGTFCKHICAVFNSGVNLLTTPNLLFQDRVDFAKLALGDDIDESFFHSMSLEVEPQTSNEVLFKQPMCLNNLADAETKSISSTENIEEEREGNNSNSTRADTFEAEYKRETDKLEENLKQLAQFAAYHPSKYMLTCIKGLNTKLERIENEESFSNICSSIQNMKRGRRIKVQPTSISRRTKTDLHAGTKAITAGRPSKIETLKKCSKRKRNLLQNIVSNQPNAKSHGSLH